MKTRPMLTLEDCRKLSAAAEASRPKHSIGESGLTDSGVSMPRRRTSSIAPPRETSIVSPSTIRVTRALSPSTGSAPRVGGA